jgi:hypothetical protein
MSAPLTIIYPSLPSLKISPFGQNISVLISDELETLKCSMNTRDVERKEIEALVICCGGNISNALYSIKSRDLEKASQSLSLCNDIINEVNI